MDKMAIKAKIIEQKWSETVRKVRIKRLEDGTISEQTTYETRIKPKTGEVYRSLSKQIDNFLNILENNDSCLSWFPLEEMSEDQIVEIAVFFIEASKETRALYVRSEHKGLSKVYYQLLNHPNEFYNSLRRQKEGNITGQNQEIEDEAWIENIEIERETNGIITKEIKSAERQIEPIIKEGPRLTDNKRVQILDAIDLVRVIISIGFDTASYELMRDELVKINDAILDSLYEERAQYKLLGLGVSYPGYCDQYIEFIYQAVNMLLFQFIIWDLTAKEKLKRIEKFKHLIGLIEASIDEDISHYNQEMHDFKKKVSPYITTRFVQYSLRKAYNEELEIILNFLRKNPPSYNQNSTPQKRISEETRKQQEICDLFSLVQKNESCYIAGEESTKNVLFHETFEDNFKYRRKTARTIVREILDDIPVDREYLWFLDMKYLRGFFHELEMPAIYDPFSDLCVQLRRLLLKPYSVADDKGTHETTHLLCSALLHGIYTSLLAG